MYVLKVPLERTISQIYYLGFTLYFMSKDGYLFFYFLKHFFLECIK